MKIIIVGNNYHYYHSPKRNIGLLIKNYEVLNENYDLLVVLIISIPSGCQFKSITSLSSGSAFTVSTHVKIK